MVVKEFSGCHILDIDFFPVAAATRNDVGKIASVVGEGNALYRNGSVGAETVWIEKDALFTTQLVHLIEHRLVLQSVVAINVPFAILLEWGIDFLVVDNLAQPFKIFGALWNLGQIGIGHCVFCFDPCCRCCAGVVFEWAIGVRHLHSEILVDGIVGRWRRIMQLLCINGSGSQRECRCAKNLFYHSCFVLLFPDMFF